MNSHDYLAHLIEFYNKCAINGFVKLDRADNEFITITVPPSNSFLHFETVIPLNIGRICYLSPKRSIKIHNDLLDIWNKYANLDYNLSDKYYISVLPYNFGKRMKIIVYDMKCKVIKKYKFKVATINIL